MQILHKLDFISPEEGICVMCTKPADNRHAHDFFELVFVDEGSARHTVGGESYGIGRGDLFLVDIGVEHGYRDMSPDFRVLNCLFLPTFLSDVVRDDSTFSELAAAVFLHSVTRPDEPFFVRAGGVPGARSVTGQLLDEYKGKKRGYLEVLQALLKVLLIYALRASAGSTAAPRSDRLTDEIMEYVARAGGRRVLVGEISRAMFFSPAYIGRIFKEKTGIPLSKFIADRRMEHVCHLLVATDRTIESILAETEYSDRKSFYEQFFRRYGCTPGEYRANRQK